MIAVLRTLPLAALAALTASRAAGQELVPATPPTAAALIARLQRLDGDRASAVVRAMERHLQRLDDALLVGVLDLERDLSRYPQQPPRTWFAPSEYAPVAAPRRLLGKGTAAHTRATAGMRPLAFLPDLATAVVYDWQLGKAVRYGADLRDADRFANYVRGYAPGADHAVARLLERFDGDPEQRALAGYFEHLYADRDGGVYAGVTLFEAWHAGALVEMPDVDVIAFARRVLGDGSFTAPLPANRRREQLYERIHAAFAAHREYRSLRLAAAAAFVAADPGLDEAYAPLVRRCHWLWVQTAGDPEAFAARLAAAADRAAFLREIDAAIRSSPEVVEQRQQALRGTGDYLRALAERELGRAGG
jgi:hypothetical protein